MIPLARVGGRGQEPGEVIDRGAQVFPESDPPFGGSSLALPRGQARVQDGVSRHKIIPRLSQLSLRLVKTGARASRRGVDDREVTEPVGLR